jgi:hypothetical protein
MRGKCGEMRASSPSNSEVCALNADFNFSLTVGSASQLFAREAR